MGTVKIGIMGGSFDPVHYGHLILAEQMRSEAGLDRVIMIPARISPFKLDQPPADAEDRLEMLRLAIGGYSGLEVSDSEIRREGPSYTYESLCYLLEQYPESEIFYIVGSDAFLEIDTWHRADELLRQFPVLVGYREGGPKESVIEEKIANLAERFSARISYHRLPELEISSSDIRRRLESHRPVKYLLPDSVLSYINEKRLYRDLLGLIKCYAEQVEKPSRLAHTKGVVRMSKDLALRYGADPYKAELAAWFHDTSRSAGNLEHGPAAARIMETDFSVTDQDVLNAVRWHTTGRPGMCLLEKILKIADNLEEGRDYEGVEALRASVSDDVNETLLMMMRHTKDYVIKIGGQFHPLSDEAMADLEKQIESEKEHE